MSRSTVLAAVLAALAWLAPPAAASGAFATTCTYFNGIAFNDLHTKRIHSFRADLARQCSAAKSILDRAEPGSRPHAQAKAYLHDLEGYRRVLIDMANRRYVRNPGRGPAERTLGRPVTRSGEILIARMTGVLAAHESWQSWVEARAE